MTVILLPILISAMGAFASISTYGPWFECSAADPRVDYSVSSIRSWWGAFYRDRLWEKIEDGVFVVVDKDEKGHRCPYCEGKSHVFLFKKSSLGGMWRVERVFRAEYGRNKGPKRVEGDQRTPEGFYLNWSLNSKKGPLEIDLYGESSLVLSYPTMEELDSALATTGQHPGCAISLHGGRVGETEGCVRIVDGPDTFANDQCSSRSVAGLVNEIGGGTLSEWSLPIAIIDHMNETCKGPQGWPVGERCASGIEFLLLNSRNGLIPNRELVISNIGDPVESGDKTAPKPSSPLRCAIICCGFLSLLLLATLYAQYHCRGTH